MNKPFPYIIATGAIVLILSSILVGAALSSPAEASFIPGWRHLSLPPAAETPVATPTPTPVLTPVAPGTPRPTPPRQFSRLALKIIKVGQGEITQNPQPGLSDNKYTSGAMVNLTAIPAYGWEFDSWSGDISSLSPTVVVVMDTEKNVTANFKAKFAALTNLAADARNRLDKMLKKNLTWTNS